MLNHVIVSSNKSLRPIFTCLRLYKIRYSMLKNKKNPVFIGFQSVFNCKTGIEKWNPELMTLDKSTLNQMGNNGRAYYEKEFDRNNLLEKLEGIFKS